MTKANDQRVNVRGRCLNPLCSSFRFSRGLCSACYQSANRLIKRGVLTWKDLERKGKSLPLLPLGYRPTEKTRFFTDDSIGGTKNE